MYHGALTTEQTPVITSPSCTDEYKLHNTLHTLINPF